MRYNSQQTKGGRYMPSPAVHQSYTVPACVGGINALDSVTAMEPNQALTLINLVPSEYGLRLRRGYREWANGMTGGEVRSVIPFLGQEQLAVGKRLWAVTSDGIWNVTAYGETTPTQDVTFVGATAGSGYGVWCEFTNDAGARFLFYADEIHGLHLYTESTGLWTAPTMTGVDPAKVAYIMVWKQRLWMIERNSGDAYYLAPGAIAGVAVLFNFGAKLSHGGELKALLNWTVDGGNGVDDMLVVVGAGGDVLIYSGTDPDQASTFQLIGGYFVGKFPASRRIGMGYGGEMYLLSTFGVISVRQLLEGVLYEDPSKGPSAKINRLLRDAVSDNITSYTWRMTTYPNDGFLQIIAPYQTDNRLNAVQFQQNLMTQAWGTWQGVPMLCGTNWDGEYMMGTPDGKVIQYYGGIDDAQLNPSAPAGVSIPFNVLTSFQAPGGDATTFKRVNFIRPIAFTSSKLNLNVRAVYDYNLSADISPPPATPSYTGAVWDASLWDNVTWGADPKAISAPRGTLGQGRVVGIAMKGNSSTRLTFIGWDVDFQSGGFL